MQAFCCLNEAPCWKVVEYKGILSLWRGREVPAVLINAVLYKWCYSAPHMLGIELGSDACKDLTHFTLYLSSLMK